MSLPAAVDRTGFAILGECTYLNSAVKGALHADVRTAASEYLDDWDRAGAPWDLWLSAVEDCRAHFARLVGVSAADVFVSGSVSVALASVVTALDLRTRPELLIFDDDFPTLGDVALGARRVGAEVRVMPAPDTGDDLVAAVEREATGRAAAVVAQWIHHAGRYELDLEAFATACHRAGAYAVVDGYHGIGAIDVRAGASGVDVLTSGAMKYLLGSAGGLALAYCSPELVAAARPIVGGWLGSADPFARDRGQLPPPATARKFETGLTAIADAFMLRAALTRITRWRMRDVEGHVRALAAVLEDELRPVVDEPSCLRSSGPLVALRARDAPRLVSQLASHDVVVGSWQDWVRFSLHGYNDGDDVERAARALAAIRDSTAL
jgi:selenocysteine lyase/cysteine desulfurase